MKRVIAFLAETFYELLLNKTIVFIALPLLFLAAWQIGEDEIVRVFGMILFYCSVGWLLFCLLQGWILRQMDNERWQALRDNANDGKPFCQTKNAWYLGLVAILLPVASIGMLLSRTPSSAPWLLGILDILSVIYLVWFISRLLHVKDGKNTNGNH